jgi:hypothetical protein
MRLRALLIVAFIGSCGPDAQPLECNGAPDFEVLITASAGPLPSDTVLKLYYGGRPPTDPEVLTLADPQTTKALFCQVTDKNGHYDATKPALGAGATVPNFGAGGEGGAGGQSDGDVVVQALACGLWTDGSANLEVLTLQYGTSSLGLSSKQGQCTVHSELVLEAMDGGV